MAVMQRLHSERALVEVVVDHLVAAGGYTLLVEVEEL